MLGNVLYETASYLLGLLRIFQQRLYLNHIVIRVLPFRLSQQMFGGIDSLVDLLKDETDHHMIAESNF